MTHIRHITGWLSDLANLTAGGSVLLSDIKPRIGGIASMLSDNFPPEAFTRASLQHVARRCKFFPTYGEACEALTEWRQQNLARRALAPPADGLTDDDHAWLKAWERYAAGDWGTDSDGNRRTGTEQNLRRRLIRLRDHSDRAFEHLIAKNPRALRIAREHGLISSDQSVLRAAAATIHSEVRRAEPADADA